MRSWWRGVAVVGWRWLQRCIPSRCISGRGFSKSNAPFTPISCSPGTPLRIACSGWLPGLFCLFFILGVVDDDGPKQGA
jgi:hypothetical protein